MPTTGRRPRRDYAEVRRFAAHRRAGQHYWKWYVFGEPFMKRVFPVVGAVVALMVLWLKVPHFILGVASVMAALIVGVGWLLWNGSHQALQRRMSSRAAGGRRGVGLGWAVAGVVVLLGSTGWLSLWSPWA
jgi:hypothetical protein